jgi:molecular chaperone GrpE
VSQEVLLSHRKRRTFSNKSDRTQVSQPAKERASKESKEIPVEGEKSIEERIKISEAKVEEHYDRLLRMTAEFDNYKKRMEREMNEFRKYANESIVKDVLPTIDNLQRALSTSSEKNENTSESIREGVNMTLKGLLDTLEKHGVVPIESLGKPFDPNFHHAVMQEESERRPDDSVSQELQKGYMINDRLLRPALVVVSKKPERSDAAETETPKKEHKIKVKIQ